VRRSPVSIICSRCSRSRSVEQTCGLGWPLPAALDDARLEALLYPPAPAAVAEQRPIPDWAVVHRELRRRDMTLSLLWEEYRTGTGARDGFGYSWFCDLYREWAGRLKPTLRQVHPAGGRVFVAVLRGSSYIFAEATWTQSLPDWIAAHVNMLTFIGGVPRQIVSDNLGAGITRACFYEPLVNRTYADLASHYATAVIPALPYKPRDKAKAAAAAATTGGRSRSVPSNGAICWRSSTIATRRVRCGSPARCPCRAGTNSSAIRRLAIPSSTASCTAPIVSS